MNMKNEAQALVDAIGDALANKVRVTLSPMGQQISVALQLCPSPGMEVGSPKQFVVPLGERLSPLLAARVAEMVPAPKVAE